MNLLICDRNQDRLQMNRPMSISITAAFSIPATCSTVLLSTARALTHTSTFHRPLSYNSFLRLKSIDHLHPLYRHRNPQRRTAATGIPSPRPTKKMTTDNSTTGDVKKPDATTTTTVSVPSITLQPDDSKLAMPVVGLGTWKAPAGVVGDVVAEAIQSGYRCIDCACDYGNEAEVGAGIRRGLQATPGLQRKDLFVTSKLWNTYHREEHVRPALQRTLSDLDLEYLDLYLIHFPISLKYVPFDVRYPPEWIHDPDGDSKTNTLVPEYVSVHETWRAMEKLVDDGLVRHIGISNFPAILIMELLSTARIKPAVLQVELHPYLQQNKLLEFCKRNNIAVTAFSPLGASSYRPLGMDKGHDLLGEQALIDLAHQHGKTPAQIALKWAVQRGSAVIPKTSRVERLAENMALFDGSDDDGSNGWQLSEEDMTRLAALDRKVRYNDPGEFCVGMGMSIPIYD